MGGPGSSSSLRNVVLFVSGFACGYLVFSLTYSQRVIDARAFPAHEQQLPPRPTPALSLASDAPPVARPTPVPVVDAGATADSENEIAEQVEVHDALEADGEDGERSSASAQSTFACAAGRSPSQCARDELNAWFVEHKVRMPAGNDLSQESLLQRLLPVWGTSAPRVMVDLGSHPAFGDIQQYGDAQIFLEYFHAPGSAVLAVDAMPDFAADVQLRLSHEQPYSGYRDVTKLSIAAWVGNADAFDPPAALPSGPNMTFMVTRQLGYCLAGHSFDRKVRYCELERQGRPGHMCRVTRQKLGIVCAPGSTGPQPQPIPGSAPKRATVPLRSIDSLWQRELGGAHVDLLKVDIEASWTAHYGRGAARLLGARKVSLLVVEVDKQWRTRPDGSQLSTGAAVADFVALCERQGYAVYLKVPCAAAVLRECRLKTLAAGVCALNAARNRTIGYERYLPISHARRNWLPAALPLQQDLLVVDRARPELIALVESFPPPCPVDGPPDIWPTREHSLSVAR